MIGAVVTWGVYSTLLKKKKFTLPLLTLVHIICTFGLISVFPQFLYELSSGQVIKFDTNLVYTLIFLALFPSIGSYYCWAGAVSIIGANRAGISLSLIPLFSSIMAILIYDEKLNIPSVTDLNKLIKDCPNDELTGARVELLHSLNNGYSEEGVYELQHNWKKASVLASAYKHKIPLTVHPGIGYDIISNHPMFNGASIGRSAQVDFQKFASSVEGLDGGVVLSVGSAIMGPQVFEKAISFVNHLRISEGKGIVNDHSLFVVDLQDGGDWDWSKGEPPITNPAYYLRFCKSYSRMGGEMNYLQCDNITFMQHLRLALMKN